MDQNAAAEQSKPKNAKPVRSESEEYEIRTAKLQAMQEEGKDPFTEVRFDRTNYTTDITENFEEMEGKIVRLAGRMMSKRIMGKLTFSDITDRYGRIQLCVKRDLLGTEEYKQFKKYDIGDIIGIEGEVFRTQKGEISVRVDKLQLLSKSLRPLPEKWHGLKDTDIRYRRRYVDLIVNPEVRRTFENRSKIVREIRNFCDSQGFMEVETPCLNTIPEFTTIEIYQAYTDYNGMMDLTENMVIHCCEKVLGTTKVMYQGTELDFSKGWKRMTMAEAVKQYSGMDFMAMDGEQALEACKKAGYEIDKNKESWGDLLAMVYDATVEENLIQPTFITDYPVEISPLAKRKASDPRLTERFECFVYGRELCNAFSELNDPVDQRGRFERQVELRNAGDDEANMMDEDFLRALEYGMPPTGGMGMGIDRLVMFLTDSASIRDVLLFPTMKPLD